MPSATSVVEALLSLVAAAGLPPGELAWLAELPLPDADGELAPAGELLLPGAALAAVLVPGELGTVEPALVERYGVKVLRAVGVLEEFALVRDSDVVLDADSCDHDLDGEDGLGGVRARLARLRPGRAVADGGAGVGDGVRGRPRPGPRRAAAVAGGSGDCCRHPPLRFAVTEPVRVLRGDGRGVDVVSYAAWWLTHPSRARWAPARRPATARRRCAARRAVGRAAARHPARPGVRPRAGGAGGSGRGARVAGRAGRPAGPAHRPCSRGRTAQL